MFVWLCLSCIFPCVSEKMIDILWKKKLLVGYRVCASWCKSGIFTSEPWYNEQIYSMRPFPNLLNYQTIFSEVSLGGCCSTDYMWENAVLEVQENVEFRLLSRTYHQKSFKSRSRKFPFFSTFLISFSNHFASPCHTEMLNQALDKYYGS